MTGGSELKLEGRRGDAEKGAVGAGRTCPIPALGGTRAVGENTACLRGGRENRVLRGQSGC